MAMSTGRLGVCSSSGPRTSRRRSVPTWRFPDIGGIDRIGNGLCGRYKLDGLPARHGDVRPGRALRALASTQKATQGSIVPSRSSLDEHRRLRRLLREQTRSDGIPWPSFKQCKLRLGHRTIFRHESPVLRARPVGSRDRGVAGGAPGRPTGPPWRAGSTIHGPDVRRRKEVD